LLERRGQFILAVTVILSQIILMNLLIAMMGFTYEQVKEDEVHSWRRWRCRLIEEHSSLIRHAAETTPFSVLCVMYKLPQAALFWLDRKLGCNRIGPLDAALRIDDEERVDYCMGPRRMLNVEPVARARSSRGERRRTVSRRRWVMPRFLGDEEIAEPQLKCHARWRRDRTSAEGEEEEEEQQKVGAPKVYRRVQDAEVRLVQGQGQMLERLRRR